MKIGDGVKVYLPPSYGRQDARIVRVIDERRRIINAKIVRSGRIARDLVYKTDVKASRGYWTELPEGYLPGSEGH